MSNNKTQLKMLNLWTTKLENRFNSVSERIRVMQIEEKEILEELCKTRKQIKELEKKKE